uniref:Protein FAR1-RELATED SEQUENCE n=1 Tax=Caenorhabditis tropicalis TaxID=1561998 RepID=A0A1I7TT45_9PELO
MSIVAPQFNIPSGKKMKSIIQSASSKYADSLNRQFRNVQNFTILTDGYSEMRRHVHVYSVHVYSVHVSFVDDQFQRKLVYESAIDLAGCKEYLVKRKDLEAMKNIRDSMKPIHECILRHLIDLLMKRRSSSGQTFGNCTDFLRQLKRNRSTVDTLNSVLTVSEIAKSLRTSKMKEGNDSDSDIEFTEKEMSEDETVDDGIPVKATRIDEQFPIY